MLQILLYPFLVLGICLVSFLPFLPDLHILLAVCLVLFFVICVCETKRKYIILLLVFLLGLLWSSWRADLQLAQRVPPSMEGKAVLLTGKVDGVASPNKFGSSIHFFVDSIDKKPIKVRKLVLLDDYHVRPWMPNSRWQFLASMKRPLSSMNGFGFDREAWYWAKGISAIGYIHKERTQLSQANDFSAKVDNVRANLLQRILRVGQNRARAAALVAALTIGVKNRITQTDWNLFRDFGIVHLVSISGLHITLFAVLVSCLVAILLRYMKFSLICPRLLIALSGLGAAAGYALLSGWSLSTQRAFYMLLLAVAMLFWRRSLPAFRVWWISLSAVLIIDPFAVLLPGLWLSFGLVASLMIATPGRVKAAKKLIAIWRAQWAINIVSIVLLSLFFGALPLASPLINALAIPFVSMLLTPLSLISLACPWDGLLKFTIWLADYSLHGLDYISAFAFVFHPALAPKLFDFLAILGALWLIAPRGVPARFAGLLLVAPLLLYRPTLASSGSFFVKMIDVGQGLSVLVHTKEHALLFDTGFGEAKRVLLPQLYSLGIRHLDMVIVSHNDSDHDGALPSLLKAISVDSVLAGQAKLESQRQLSRPVESCQQGQHWNWDKVNFDILAPAKTWQATNNNEASCVLRISSGKQSFLVTGDLPARGEQRLVDDYGVRLRSNILSAGHHGSKSSSSEPFLANVAPEQVWISAGYRNRYHLPNQKVLARFAAHRLKIWRTDFHGAIQTRLGLDAQQTSAQRVAYLEFWRVRPTANP